MANKIFRVLVLAVLVVSVLCFVGCKDEAVVETNSDLSNVIDSADPDRDQTNSNDNVSSGLELEEDIFEDGDVDNAQSSNSSTNSTNSSNTDNISSNQSTTSTPSTPSSDNSSGDEGNDNSSEDDGIIEEDDGTVKLPVDWF